MCMGAGWWHHRDSLPLLPDAQVRCLLRVSVYHMSAMRGLFPEDFYKDVNMKNLDGRLHALICCLVHEWPSRGVDGCYVEA